jgi:hypothetical protein
MKTAHKKKFASMRVLRLERLWAGRAHMELGKGVRTEKQKAPTHCNNKKQLFIEWDVWETDSIHRVVTRQPQIRTLKPSRACAGAPAESLFAGGLVERVPT